MRQLFLLYLLAIITGCGVAKSSFSPEKKYSPEALQKDYAIYRKTLEEAHPGLYWYTSKDSMDFFFDKGRALLNDSLSESAFRKILSYVTAKINCGHTAVRPSKSFLKYQDTVRVGRVFPISLKLWQDTAVVAANLNRRDTILKRGTIITSINGMPMDSIVDTLFSYLGTDGYNRTNKYQVLSNRGFFGSLYSTIFGYPSYYRIGFIDSAGRSGTVQVRPYLPVADTTVRSQAFPRRQMPQPSRRERKQMRRNNVRLLKMDTTTHVAMMDLNSFGRGYGLKPFFRRSFKALRKNNITHLIIDVRGNGGGSVTNSTLLTKFIADHPFKVSDSLYAVKKRKTYSRYIESDFFNRLFMTLFATKRKDGRYHFRYYERHAFKPKKRNHFNGKTYILIGGNSFSATTLFAGAVKDQENVTLVGEETGGGAYGNSAWLIPDMTLPNTKVRFRLPLFRLVIDKNVPKDGRGVQPEIPSLPTVDAVRKGVDYKLEKTMQLINESKAGNAQQ
ncbi:S41 family peptidase [Terrimonas sp. NA20]|uniref:S41 family peptidase n=1 Tax=Terrimonas ginsenosidimutans TaxID=2908004 RepID=A0ABS9KL30_9BACT|nr:S41 family peptidase [Terrimonas ginsenosidimutans]MCG2613026.1 S41 family peptidase [Terrimonas ginsenosidimutans]